MPDVLGITTPIFLLIGLGFASVRTGLFAKAALPALGSFVITFCIPALIPLCLAVADSASARHEPLALAFGRALLGLRRNPIVLGIVGGLAMALLGWHLPAPVQRAVELPSLASAAASLFFIGGNLVGLHVGALAGQVTAVAVGKLLLHPLAVLLALRWIEPAAGPVSAALQWSAVLMAAAPMLGIYPILGQRYGRQAVNAATILVATVASFGTLALVIWLLQTWWDLHLPP